MQIKWALMKCKHVSFDSLASILDNGGLDTEVMTVYVWCLAVTTFGFVWLLNVLHFEPQAHCMPRRTRWGRTRWRYVGSWPDSAVMPLPLRASLDSFLMCFLALMGSWPSPPTRSRFFRYSLLLYLPGLIISLLIYHIMPFSVSAHSYCSSFCTLSVCTFVSTISLLCQSFTLDFDLHLYSFVFIF